MKWIKAAIDVETRGMSLTSGLAFFIGVPVIVAFLVSWNNTLVSNEVNFLTSLGFWIGLDFIIWVSYIVSTGASYWLLRRWQPSLLWVLLGGQAISLIVFTWPSRVYLIWGLDVGRMAPIHYSDVTVGLTGDYLLQLFYGTLPAAAIWFSTNLFYKHIMKVPRYHYGEWQPQLNTEKGPLGVSMTPAFLKRLPDQVKGDIVALKAEDHYVRVYTDKGDSLIHYRFKDALADISSLPGVQTHRSYWVEQSAITSLESDGQSSQLTLRTGLKVPVSRTYLNEVKRLVAKLPL